MSACLIKLLLLRAGIEPNPGPYICPVCNIRLSGNSRSVRCNKCEEWVHWRKTKNNCSDLTYTKDYDASFTCRSCKFDPLPNLPSHTQVPHTSTSKPSHTSTTKPPNTSTPTTIPSPQQSNQQPDELKYDMKILQWNCNGIRNKLTELANFIDENNIKIVVLQETKLTANSSPPNIDGFTLVRKDRGKDKGGGLAIFIHKSIIFQHLDNLPEDNHTESQAIKVGNIKITNIYIPPTSSCVQGYTPSLQPFLTDDSLILGDINAHDELWFSSIQDTRGANLAEEIAESNFGVLNENTPTRVPSNNQPTSPDISMASYSLLPNSKWETITSLGSDHLPIIITLSTTIKPSLSENRKYINFNKAVWPQYQEDIEKAIDNLKKLPPSIQANINSSVHKSEKIFRSIVNKASRQNIPGGRIKEVIPEIPTATKEKIDRRDQIRIADPNSPELAELNREIYTEINTHKNQKWVKKVTDIKSCSSNLYKLIKNLQGKNTASDNQAIKFKGKYISKSLGLANAFNKQYCSIKRHVTSSNSRVIWKNNKKFDLKDTITVTPEQTLEAIVKSKASKAIGPDQMSNLHLKHLGPKAIAFLTQIYNTSLKDSVIPDIWKTSIVIPLLKPGKPANDSNSYRPVSLLCPAIKIMERLILPTMSEHLPVPEFQHGFRKDHSTITALNEFTDDITNGFNKKIPPDRTVLLQIDLSKAFDMVSHDKLIDDLNGSELPSGLKRWLCAYLLGRQSKVNFRNQTSEMRNIKAGVPQGAVTSPLLFNFYLTKLPRPPPGIKLIQYADDISIYAIGRNIDMLATTISEYAKSITEYLAERELIVSPEKSTVTLFTPDTKEVQIHPQVKLNDHLVPLCKTPKLLGVTFDSMLTFSEHVKKAVSSTKNKINIMKSLAGSTWGQDKETLILTYKSIGRSVLEYGSPIWSPIISESNWTKIQSTQNQALRIATGNVKMAHQDHLHQETQVLPVKEHTKMTSEQFLLNCHLPNHPGNKQISRPLPARRMKPTIQNYRHTVQDLLPVTDKKDLKKKQKTIHTKHVSNTINNYIPNKVLDQQPPKIDQKEKSLSRNSRSLLSQLRSGYSRKLNSYLHRINDEVEDKCPECNIGPHTTNHLFNCQIRPTDLSSEDLWKNPVLAAGFLDLDEGVT